MSHFDVYIVWDNSDKTEIEFFLKIIIKIDKNYFELIEHSLYLLDLIPEVIFDNK